MAAKPVANNRLAWNVFQLAALVLTILGGIWAFTSGLKGDVKDGFRELKQDGQRTRETIIEHLTDPDIHHSGLNKTNTRLDAVEKRVDRIEERGKGNEQYPS